MNFNKKHLGKRVLSNSSMNVAIKSSISYFIGSVLSKVVVFILLPVYTFYVSPSDFGYYDLSIAYITLLTSTLFFDVWISVMRFMHDEKNRHEVISAGFNIFKISSILYIILYAVFVFCSDVRHLELIFMFGLLTCLANMYMFITRGYKDNKSFAISGLINTFIGGLLTVLLFTIFKFDISALFIGSIAGLIAQVYYLETKVKIRRYVLSNISNTKLTKTIFIYTLPLCVNSISYWLITSYNRVVINENLSLSANGIYAIGNRFGAIIALITMVFTYVWQDVSFAKAADPEAAKFYSKASNFYVTLLGCGTALVLPVFNISFSYLVNNQYSDAKVLVPLFVILAALSAFIAFLGGIFHALKQTKHIFYSMFFASFLNVVICTALVKQFGLIGAISSAIISLLAAIFIRVYILRRYMTYRAGMVSFILTITWVALTIYIYLYGNFCANIVIFFINLATSMYILRNYIIDSLVILKSFIRRRA